MPFFQIENVNTITKAICIPAYLIEKEKVTHVVARRRRQQWRRTVGGRHDWNGFTFHVCVRDTVFMSSTNDTEV